MQNVMHLLSAHPIEQALASGNDARLVEEIKKIDSSSPLNQKTVSLIKKLARETNSSKVRNTAVLKLADLRAPRVKSILIGLLNRPDTKGSRGTILYALENLDAKLPLELLKQLIIEDNYETREEALNFIAQGNFDRSRYSIADARKALRTALASADPQRSHTINAALKYLSA
jgi:hypothetical protein